MFERRLKWFVLGMSAIALVIVVRLVDIQVVRAAQFESLADRLLTRPVRYLAAPRGEIQDRAGRTLVSDEPAWDVSVHYGVLAGRGDYLRAVARELRRRGRLPANRSDRELADDLKIEVAQMWRQLAELTGRPVADFIERSHEVQARVEHIREIVSRASGIPQAIREEYAFHPLIEGVDEDLALRIRADMESRYPWLTVAPGARRLAPHAESRVHVLGRLGEASVARIEDDPLRDQELRRLRPGDLCGVSGVERLADPQLRGTRGRVIEDFDHAQLERIEPLRGQDVRLTIDAALQERIYGLVEQAVKKSVYPAGGSAVVIDVATREIVALVSYPGYAFERFASDYGRLARDAHWTPLLFRAVAGEYPPGSTGKVLTLLGGLSEGVVSPSTRIHCTGHLLPNQPGMFRCWIYNTYSVTHDSRGYPDGLDAAEAIQNSCNIYFFKVGERLGPSRLCDWFQRGGLGRRQGTGLIEESAGIVPDDAWIAANRPSEPQLGPADAWNFAIGQGEVTATPLQAANVAATVASGRFEPVRLLRDGPAPFAAGATEFDEAALRVIRNGMWRVVNDPSGTAKYALLDSKRFVLCGKTGSAQAVPRVLTYRFTYAWPDGRRKVIVAGTEDEAAAQLEAEFPDDTGAAPQDIAMPTKRPRLIGKHAEERFPPWTPEEKLPSHAWFIGFTQPAATPRGARPAGPVYALSVLIEYGGSGGHDAGPLAKQIAQVLLGIGEAEVGAALSRDAVWLAAPH